MTAPVHLSTTDTHTASDSIRKAAGAKKCWACGCLHSSLKAIQDTMEDQSTAKAEATPLWNSKRNFRGVAHGLVSAMAEAKRRFVEVQYDCLGCTECYPADAINALGMMQDTCSADPVERRDGWPPLPGSHVALRYKAPVAVCTLTDECLYERIREQAGPETAIVGMLQTENLGIERIIENILANPNIRFLILCGADSRQRIGHLPGQSLVALAHCGTDEQGRIINAKGKRPVICNLAPDMVEHFRSTVEVVNRIDATDVPDLLFLCDSLAQRNPGVAKPFLSKRIVKTLRGYLPDSMTSDPNGYFVIYADHLNGMLSMEHYINSGVLDVVIEGKSAAEIYVPAIEKSLISRLDHAAYLGRELGRAEQCLKTSCSYIQDGAPERISAEKSLGCESKDNCGSP